MIGIARACRLLADGPEADQRVELVGERDDPAFDGRRNRGAGLRRLTPNLINEDEGEIPTSLCLASAIAFGEATKQVLNDDYHVTDNLNLP